MSNNAAESHRVPPNRPRHQITRSISELSPRRQNRQNQSNNNNGGNNSTHLRRDKESDDRISFPLTLMPVPLSISSLDASKPEGVPPSLIPNQSRRTSVLVVSSEDNGAIQGIGSVPMRKISRDEELRLERHKAAARASGLKKSLVDLNTFSNATTRRLDDAYYSVLEKMGVLESTIIALKELASMAQETDATFKKESEVLFNDISSQLDSFGQFDGQQARIETLQSRIDDGMAKVKALSERVDLVHRRIEGWERADREWQERTRRRLKVIWVATSIVIFLLLLLVISAQYVPAGLEEATVGVANESLNDLRNASRIGEDTAAALESEVRRLFDASLNQTAKEPPPPPVDERLRVFDEL